MTKFVLDTSGKGPPAALPGALAYTRTWKDLDSFTQGYIEAMFFTETDHGHDMEAYAESEAKSQADWALVGRDRYDWQGSIPTDAGFRHLSAAALEAILKACAKFQEGEAWKAYLESDHYGESADALEAYVLAGRDFWYTRNHHGCGFWDGDWPEPHGTALTNTAYAFGEVDIYWNPKDDEGEVCL